MVPEKDFNSKLQPDSLCALSATDKSVDLLGNKNKVKSKTLSKKLRFSVFR